ncbi:hypothetical protein CA267_016370 [Alteromonas pelagimontana]|uniref:Uncharacterized protein n=1 Tax=Alteromonas pelagimontana TaxID=1858656 RepID=A0A6M4MGL4_9ALTE|nr:hypothetical protein [Alteromonas pelagimontana]QJR82213.1 hypothetical protein CA267_016370 [Alteromonas pelagimontana]
MNKKYENPDNIYTQQVKQLIEMVHPQDPEQASVYEDARRYFALTPSLEAHAHELKMQLGALQENTKKEEAFLHLKDQLKATKKKLEDERLQRVAKLRDVSLRLLELCEGDTFEETQLLSSKFLGTIMLITQGTERNFARLHQRLKPLYKAVLTLRLVDRLLEEESISHPYLSHYRESLNRFRGNYFWQEKWQTELAIPLITGAILQDIGLQHPDALLILNGKENDQDEFRLLEETQRKLLLKLNYHHTMSYLQQGLGLPAYIGNDKAERDQFFKTHQIANQFRQQLVKDAFVSKSGIGELLKIPQIYVSIVLSTKADYDRKSLPKGYMLIEQLAKKGALNPRLAEAFIKIVGYFPQGFGITFIPVNERGQEKNQYEYAIVTQLNPKDPAEPMCRIVSRNLTYISSGTAEIISKSRNLFFPANRQKLMRVGKDRLIEIMSQLSNNFNSEDIDNLVPPLWEPNEFFSNKRNQNLWNRSL